MSGDRLHPRFASSSTMSTCNYNKGRDLKASVRSLQRGQQMPQTQTFSRKQHAADTMHCFQMARSLPSRLSKHHSRMPPKDWSHRLKTIRSAPSICAKRALASSAALAASRGRMKMFGTESIAAMDKISFEHLQSPSAQFQSSKTNTWHSRISHSSAGEPGLHQQ